MTPIPLHVARLEQHRADALRLGQCATVGWIDWHLCRPVNPFPADTAEATAWTRGQRQADRENS